MRITGATLGAALVVATLALPVAGAETRMRFGHLTVEDGLSQIWVQAIVKDRRGFMWFGTFDGLDRYDGSTFKHYRASETGNTVNCVFEDGQGRLWVGFAGRGGLARYDRDQDRFVRYPFDPKHDALPGEDVRALAEDRDGLLWVGTQNGIARLDPDKGAVTRYQHNPRDPATLTNNAISALLFDREGRLWAGTPAGLNRLDTRSGKVLRWPQRADHPGSLSHPDVQDILEDGEGLLWLATLGGGLNRLDPTTSTTTRFLPEPGNPNSISHSRLRRLETDGQGTLYIGTENGGLALLDTRSGKFSHALPDADDPLSLTSASIYALYLDNQGVLWIGTFNGGVNLLSSFGQRFEHLRAGRLRLSDPHVTAIVEDGAGQLWIGTDGGGLNQLDRRTGRYTTFRHDPRDATTITNDAVVSVYADRLGTLWVGTWAGGLSQIDPRTGRGPRYVHNDADPTSILNSTAWTVRELNERELVVATYGGVDIFDRATRRFSRVAARCPKLPQEGAYDVEVDAQGVLWVAFTSDATGIWRVDLKTGAAAQVPSSATDPTRIAQGMYQDIYVDAKDNVWIASDNGLSVLEAGNRRVRRYTTDDGLPVRRIASVLEDAAGHLWLGTSRGLCRLAEGTRVPEKLSVLTFDVHDGLQGSEFKRAAALRARNGEMYFCGPNGCNAFTPETVESNPHVPPVVLTALRIKNQEVLPGAKGSPLTKSIVETELLKLGPSHTVVTFEFAALNFIVPQKNRYAYRLEGLEDKWNEVGAQRFATYSSLPAGTYTFHVQGTNNDGLKNEKGVSLRVHVDPPFVRSWPFYILVTIALLIVASLWYRWRVREMEDRRRELEGQVTERTADLSREIGQHRQTEERLQEQVAERERAQEALERENDERRRAEELAGRERDLLHTLMDNIPDLIYFKDADSRFTRVNRAHAAAMGLATPDEIVGRTDFDLLTEAFARASWEDERAILASGRPLIGKVEHDVRNGRWYLATKVPLRDAEGKAAGLVGISKDITERRQAEEQLERDLQALLEVVSRVAQGDLSARGAAGDGTLGRIAGAVNEMLEGFSGILADVRDTAFSVSTSSTEILAAATQIAKGAQYGSDQVHTTSSAVEQMAASMSQVSRHADTSEEKTRQVLEHVRQSAGAVDATDLGIVRIDAAVTETADKMRLLEQRSHEIFEIIGLIEEIATQSKLLSLNAAIEAAHAGDAGRGFAVVADEVRRLADSSTSATKDVAQRVQAIVKETQSVLTAMQNAMHEVKEGRQLSEQARSSLREISTLVQDSAHIVLQISSASREQASATKTVAEAMQAISNISVESAAGANETSKAVRDLVSMSDQLNAAISRFRIDRSELKLRRES